MNSLVEKNVEKLEFEMLKHDQVPCPVQHSFGDGVYIRQVSIPAGTFSIGHLQKTEHMNVFVKGKVTMIHDDGSVETLTAPMTFVSKPGRKVGYIHEDMVWLNIYATHEKEVDKLEEKFLDKSASFKEAELNRSISLITGKIDADDFGLAIKELGFSNETVKAQSENTDDQCDLPSGSYKIKTGKSLIHGTGLIATGDILENEVIAPARISGKRTIAGRFTNHSKNPNAEMIAAENGDIYLKAIRNISGCVGGFDGEEITVCYRQAIKVNKQISGEV